MQAHRLLLVTAALGAAVTAQQKPAQSRPAQPRFAVVSIRVQPPGSRPKSVGGPVFPGGKYINERAGLWSLVVFAYPQYSFVGKTLVGLPAWSYGQVLFAVDAEPAPGTVPDLAEMRKMMASVLMDRFGLKYHVVQRRMPVLLLEAASSGLRHVKPSAAGKPELQLHISPSGVFGRGATMGELASLVAVRLQFGGKPVVNRTGLTGFYDIDGPAASGTYMGRMGNESMIIRLLRTIGLKLVSGEATVPVLVVDHVSMPTPN